jgi:hypothetical protein
VTISPKLLLKHTGEQSGATPVWKSQGVGSGRALGHFGNQPSPIARQKKRPPVGASKRRQFWMSLAEPIDEARGSHAIVEPTDPPRDEAGW